MTQGTDKITNLNNSGLIIGDTTVLVEVHNLAGMNDIGNGIYFQSTDSIENSGVIDGHFKTISYGYKNVGNGIFIAETMKKLVNSGIISGSGIGYINSENGNGVRAKNFGDIINSGTILGNSISGNEGAGISADIVGNVKNTGVVLGRSNAIKFEGTPMNPEKMSDINNYGIFASWKSVLSKVCNGSLCQYDPPNYTNYGIEIKTDYSNNITKIKNGKGGVIDGKTIINAQRYDEAGNKTDKDFLAIDSYILASELSKKQIVL